MLFSCYKAVSYTHLYVPEKNSAENTEAMLQAIEHVKTGQITYAVRDTRIDDKEIHEGDICLLYTSSF